MTHQYSNPTSITKASMALMVVVSIMSGIVGLNIVLQVVDFGRFRDSMDMDIARRIDQRAEMQEGLTAFFVFAGVVSGIVFLRWTYVVARNAHALADHTVDTTPGMAVGWYFIPIANLWKPLTSLNEVVEASRPSRSHDSAPTGFYWLLHILALVGDRIVAAVIGAANGIDDLDTMILGQWMAVVTTGILVALNIVACVMVGRVSKMQVEKYREVGDAGYRSSRGGAGGPRDCPSCGEPVASTDRVCSMCGHRLTPRTFLDREPDPDPGDEEDEWDESRRYFDDD